jgi:hypothetical protein
MKAALQIVVSMVLIALASLVIAVRHFALP